MYIVLFSCGPSLVQISFAISYCRVETTIHDGAYNHREHGVMSEYPLGQLSRGGESDATIVVANTHHAHFDSRASSTNRNTIQTRRN